MTTFTPVPLGTPAAAALNLRGTDPDVLYVVGTDFQTSLGCVIGERTAVGGQRVVQYSSSCGAMAKTKGLVSRVTTRSSTCRRT